MATLMRFVVLRSSRGTLGKRAFIAAGREIRTASRRKRKFLRPQCPGLPVRRKCEWIQTSAEILARAIQPPHEVSARRPKNHVVFFAADLSDVSDIVDCIAE